MCIFGSVQPKSECNFPFLYNLIFQLYHVSSPLTPLREEIDICSCGRFCPKFDAKKLSFEAFLGKMRIFGSVQPKRECNFPFLYNLIFKPYHLSRALAPLWVRSFLLLNNMKFYECVPGADRNNKIIGTYGYFISHWCHSDPSVRFKHLVKN